MDLLIKLLKSKSHNLIVVEGSTFALIEGEKIQISLRERNKKVEFIDDYKSIRKDTHPTGILYIKREEGYSNKEWKDGKIPLEDQLIKIIEDLTSIAKEQKEDNLRRKKSQEEQAEQNRLQQEFEKRQKIELANFKGLLLDAHRFWLSTMVRDYVARVEMNAKSSDALTQETQEWISWARKKAGRIASRQIG